MDVGRQSRRQFHAAFREYRLGILQQTFLELRIRPGVRNQHFPTEIPIVLHVGHEAPLESGTQL